MTWFGRHGMPSSSPASEIDDGAEPVLIDDGRPVVAGGGQPQQALVVDGHRVGAESKLVQQITHQASSSASTGQRAKSSPPARVFSARLLRS